VHRRLRIVRRPAAMSDAAQPRIRGLASGAATTAAVAESALFALCSATGRRRHLIRQ